MCLTGRERGVCCSLTIFVLSGNNLLLDDVLCLATVRMRISAIGWGYVDRCTYSNLTQFGNGNVCVIQDCIVQD